MRYLDEAKKAHEDAAFAHRAESQKERKILEPSTELLAASRTYEMAVRASDAKLTDADVAKLAILSTMPEKSEVETPSKLSKKKS